MFLFLTGLVISLFSIHHTIARVILVATVVCGFVYMVITVMPVFYRNSPYQSPLSGVIWSVPRKMARIVLSAVSQIVSLQKHTGFIRTNKITSLIDRISKCKNRLSVSMARAYEAAADKQHWSIDARALTWTLDQSDEESELEKFVAAMARFSQSVRVEYPMEMLKQAIDGSKLHHSLYREVTNLLIHATDPGLLRGSKLLPESVKQRRIEMCSEALFFIPQTMEKILRRISENLDERKVMRAFESVLKSRVAWGIALRFSTQWERNRINNKKLESVIVGARCIAAVMATQLQDTRSILTEQLGISDSDPYFRRYLDSRHRDSFLLINLNQFIANTALEFIHIQDTDILISTVHIIIQGLRFKNAARKLRIEFSGLYAQIQKVYYMRETEAAWNNAKALKSELLTLLPPAPVNGNAPAPTAQAVAPITTPNAGTAHAIQFPSPTSASSPPPGHVYVPMPPETPSGETYPLMPMPTPTPMPSNHTHLEQPPSVALPTITVASSGDEGIV